MEEENQSLKNQDDGGERVEEVKSSSGGGGGGGGGGGWGGWGFTSILSDLQKAAEEISRNAAEAAKNAAKSIGEIEADDNLESSKDEKGAEESSSDEEKDSKNNQLRKSTLDKLEKASEDTLLSQGLKVFDNSVENLASGAWQTLGSAWKGGSSLVQKLESSAVNLAETIQHGGLPTAAGSVAPSLLETGKAFTAKGMQVLEFVGKETMDLLISETGIDVEKNPMEKTKDDHLYEEVTFDRCFYIYGGPEQLEELEALSSHYALLFNRRKAKLPSEQKSLYDGKLKEVQQIFNLTSETDGSDIGELEKGKQIESSSEGNDNEMNTLHDSSIRKAADMATGFTNAISGLSASEMIQRTAGRLEALHSEGVHRISEMCCYAVTHLLMLGKSIISTNNKAKDEDDSETLNIDWPEDSIQKAKIVRLKTLSMTGYIEAVSRSFLTGISDVAEAYTAAIKVATADSPEVPSKASVQEKANFFSEHLCNDEATAVLKIQDGLQYLSYVVITSSMPSA